MKSGMRTEERTSVSLHVSHTVGYTHGSKESQSATNDIRPLVVSRADLHRRPQVIQAQAVVSVRCWTTQCTKQTVHSEIKMISCQHLLHTPSLYTPHTFTAHTTFTTHMGTHIHGHTHTCTHTHMGTHTHGHIHARTHTITHTLCPSTYLSLVQHFRTVGTPYFGRMLVSISYKWSTFAFVRAGQTSFPISAAPPFTVSPVGKVQVTLAAA